MSPDGLILTNWHVVDMAAHREQLDAWETHAAAKEGSLKFDLDETQVVILRTEGTGQPQPAFVAHVVAEDHALDFAVLQITGDADGAPLDAAALNEPFVPLGDSDTVRQGDSIHVFGYPAIGGGSLQYTLGVVSGFEYEEGITGPAWITTDASISGGSSGGTGVDTTGRLIGVPTLAGQLDCRPGDTNGDGAVTAEDVGCVPIGGSLGQLRPINLAKPMLSSAGWTASEEEGRSSQPSANAEPAPTATPAATNTASSCPEMPDYDPGTLVQNTEDVIMRDGPWTDNAVVVVLPAGTELQVTGDFQEAGHCDWWPVTATESGSQGSCERTSSNQYHK